MAPARALIRRWLLDDRGQDLVEYALLGALLAVTGVAAYELLRLNLGTSYLEWDTNVQGLWDMPCPAANPCPP